MTRDKDNCRTLESVAKVNLGNIKSERVIERGPHVMICR